MFEKKIFVASQPFMQKNKSGTTDNTFNNFFCC